MTYDHDANGNRTHSRGVYSEDGQTRVDKDNYQTYDAMNRMIYADAIKATNGQLILGQNGDQYTYDLLGRKTNDTYLGQKINSLTGQLEGQGQINETYSWDNAIKERFFLNLMMECV